MKSWPQRLLIDRAVRDCEFTRAVVRRWRHGPVEEIDDPQSVIASVRAGPRPRTAGKRMLLLTRFPGRFVKLCQGLVEGAVCCDYVVIDVAQNCPLDCTYCILQSYLNNPLLVQYANLEELLAEAEQFLGERAGRPVRFGSGELSDSLALDPLTGLSAFLAQSFARLPTCVLELKTKTDNVAELLAIPAPANTIVSWSMNTPELIRSEEPGSAPLERRLAAARRCQEHGYRIGLHFDPLIRYPQWERDYRATVRRIFEVLEPERRIAWISLGALRFPRGMKELIRRRFPGSLIGTGELLPGADGKLRYYQPLRVELYAKMVEWLREISPSLEVYLCMESPEVWRQVFADPLHKNAQLAVRLERSCGLCHG
jgi:spore photoproduct lyase